MTSTLEALSGANNGPVLTVEELSVTFRRKDAAPVRAVDGVTFDVNSGEVVVGAARVRSSFLSGATVNVCARLEQNAAPGGILVGEDFKDAKGDLGGVGVKLNGQGLDRAPLGRNEKDFWMRHRDRYRGRRWSSNQ
jgi:class 3 adenylate cyclase